VGAVAALSAVCLAISSCSLLEAPPAPPPKVESIPPVQTDYSTVTGNEHAKRLGGRYFTDADRGLLVGPHFLIRQQSIGTVTEIGQKTANLLGLDEPIRAPEGHEFVVADFSKYVGYDHDVPAKGRQPGSLPGSKYEQTILVGESKRRLYANLAEGKLLIVTAPLKSRVLLRMTDSGRTQYLDLRTGLRRKDAVSGYYPGRDFGPTRPEDATRKAWRRTGLTSANVSVAATIRDARAELSPFRPDGTWERSGKYAWLYVTVQVTAACEHAKCSMVLSPGKHIRVRTKSGATPKAVGSSFRTVDLLKVGSTKGTATYAYRVPRSTRSATAIVSPSGPVTVKAGNKVKKTGWRVAPKPIALPLSWR